MHHTIQISYQGLENGSFPVQILYESEVERCTASARIVPVLTPQDHEDIRWYLEEYLLFPFEPAPKVAGRVEQRIQAIGESLYHQVFESSEASTQIWRKIRSALAQTRFEILPETMENVIPWELLRSPLDPMPIACQAEAFLRIRPTEETQPRARQTETIRVLMVISRPGGAVDVRFRSVAARVLNQLGGRQTIEFEVLRPPTFEALENQLSRAFEGGRPYNIVHFDGHGIYEDLVAKYANRPPKRKRGYLLFENPDKPGQPDPVDGRRLAGLLKDFDVPILLLNACRSARSEQSATPAAADQAGEAVRSFGSLAEELIQERVSAVVAMQYNIYIHTAAKFIASIYAALANGSELPDAVQHARQELYANPLRTVVSSPRSLQDWMVPVLYQTHATRLDIPTTQPLTTRPDRLSNLPPPPDSGFIGRDNTLLELERKYLSEQIVFLWGAAGCGKTTLSVEFARWLAHTAGVIGPILYLSFYNCASLAQVLDFAANIFKHELAERGIEWLAMNEQQRILLLLEILQAKPGFWIWDSVDLLEPEANSTSGWTAGETARLKGFLIQAAQAGARVLLTARTRQVNWLTDLVAPVELGAFDLEERIELTQALLGPDRPFEAEVWLPLLNFSQGNPFALSILVRQAADKGIHSPESMAGFIEDVRSAGDESLFETSLVYTLRQGFTQEEQAVLSLCALFEGVVNEATLDFLLLQKDPHEVTAIIPSPPYQSTPLLERAARLGVLTAIADGYYAVHPGLPAYFQKIFRENYTADQAFLFARGFVWVYAMISEIFTKQYQSTEFDQENVPIQTLKANEPCLRRALDLARQNGFWSDAVTILYSLRTLYRHYERWTELERLFEEVSPDFIDPATEEPRPGQEYFLPLLQDYQVEFMRHVHRLSEAERIQQAIVKRDRDLIASERKRLPKAEQDVLAGRLAGNLLTLATIQKDQDEPACLENLEEALDIAQRLGDAPLECAIAYQMAGALTQQKDPNLDEADYWLSYALDISPEEDRKSRGIILSALGAHEYLRFNNLQESVEDQVNHLSNAIRYLENALQILPNHMTAAQAVCFLDLGLAYFSLGGDLTRSIQSLQQAVSLFETTGDAHHAGNARLNLATVYHAAHDHDKSTLFAEAALLTFAALAPNAEADLVEAQNFLEKVSI